MSDSVVPSPAPCPSCGVALPPNAVFCTHCGLNLKTGQKVESTLGSSPDEVSDARRKAAIRLGTTIGTIVALILVATLAQRWLNRATAPEAAAPEAPVVASPAAPSPAASDPLGNRLRAEIQQNSPRLVLGGGETDTSSEAYKDWQTGLETAAVREGMLNVSGPRYVVPTVVAGLRATPFWPELEQVLAESTPDAPLQVVVGFERRTATGSGGGGSYKASATILTFTATHSLLPGSVPPDGEDYVGYTPGMIAMVPELSAQDCAFRAADRAAAGALSADLPRMAARVALAIPAVSARVGELVDHWLATGDLDQVEAALACQRAKRSGMDKAALALARHLDTTDDAKRMRVLTALVTCGNDAVTPVLPRLLALRDHEHAETQALVRGYLGNYRFEDGTLPQILEMVKHGDSRDREYVASMLSFGRHSPSLRPSVREVITVAMEAEPDQAAKAKLAEYLARVHPTW